MKSVIFGAQGYALATYEAIEKLNPEKEIMCFAVSSLKNNPSTLAGIPVVELDSFADAMSLTERAQVEVVIATPENVHPEIVESLSEYGFKNLWCLTSERWSDLMDSYYSGSELFRPLRALTSGNSDVELNVYMAKSHKDKPLKNPYIIPDYIHPVQVGAANTEERIADIRDNTGINISKKNANYCELTGLYWMWKNQLLKEDSDHNTGQYFGLFQYRRIFDLNNDDIRRLSDHNVDVILPYPLMYEPDINEHHNRYIKEPDWNALVQAIRELHPDSFDRFEKILSGRYLYNYNVILAKKAVLTDYCEWLFPILERVEELSDPKGCERADRYIGYMGETLETLYFMDRADKLNVVHLGCRLLV